MPTLRHFLDTQDFSRAELLEIIALTRQLKAAAKDGVYPKLLPDASLAMIFEEPSTRTRLSFEVAMTQLGGHALYLKPGEIHLGARESIYDTARVISRMVDGIMLRALKHSTLTELAAAATVPVINGLTDYNHPTQVVCDLLTMMEHLPEGKDLSEVQVTFIGDATNVLSSLMHLCTQMGMHFTQAAPERYQPPPAWRAIAEANCQDSGGTLTITEDVQAAVKQADFIYTDLWWWVGQEAEIPERTAAFMPTYQVTPELMALAPTHCKFMHCLPASRGVEVTDAVMDSPQSIIYDQSENRLHTEKGLLAWLLGPRILWPGKKTARRYYEALFGLLAERISFEPPAEEPEKQEKKKKKKDKPAGGVADAKEQSKESIEGSRKKPKAEKKKRKKGK